jgi:hypothetical protein
VNGRLELRQRAVPFAIGRRGVEPMFRGVGRRGRGLEPPLDIGELELRFFDRVGGRFERRSNHFRRPLLILADRTFCPAFTRGPKDMRRPGLCHHEGRRIAIVAKDLGPLISAPH